MLAISRQDAVWLQGSSRQPPVDLLSLLSCECMTCNNMNNAARLGRPFFQENNLRDTVPQVSTRNLSHRVCTTKYHFSGIYCICQGMGKPTLDDGKISLLADGIVATLIHFLCCCVVDTKAIFNSQCKAVVHDGVYD